MAPLTFADTHNMIAFLTKSDASEFLNAHTIQYTLMVNPPIYVSCIKQFWGSISVKKTNDVVKLQALIDRKKVVITEDTICQDIGLDDADGVDCVPNEEIFAELARMGYEKPPPKLTFYKAFFSAQWKSLIHTIVQCMSVKRTAWNEFSSSMASAVICLATGRKFNFSKYIFDSMVRNVDSPSKFLMYPWFLQVKINAQFDDISSHTTKYTSTTLTQKTVAEEEDDDDEVSATPTLPSPTHEPSPPLQEHISSTPQAQPAPPSSPPQAQPTDTSMTLLHTLIETCASLSQKVAHLEQDKVAQALEITKLKQRVKKLEKKRRFKHSGLKRLRKGRMEEDVIAVKEVNDVEHVVFDDEEMQEKHLENIKKYTKFKEETNLCSSSQEKHDCIFEEYGWVEDATLQGDEEPTKKRVAKKTLLHESFKKLRAEVDVSSAHTTQQDTPTVDPSEISKEDVQNMLQIVPMVKFKVKALQVKYPLIDWEIYSEGSKTY
nr:hypothetical protein [Tanacetum cinerariifolium]